MRNEITLTDDQIIEAFTTIYDDHPDHVDIDMDEITFTRDPMECFTDPKIRRWREWDACHPDWGQYIQGFDLPCAHFERVQARKGQQRRDIYVIDFGPVRAVLFD